MTFLGIHFGDLRNRPVVGTGAKDAPRQITGVWDQRGVLTRSVIIIIIIITRTLWIIRGVWQLGSTRALNTCVFLEGLWFLGVGLVMALAWMVWFWVVEETGVPPRRRTL